MLRHARKICRICQSYTNAVDQGIKRLEKLIKRRKRLRMAICCAVLVIVISLFCVFFAQTVSIPAARYQQ